MVKHLSQQARKHVVKHHRHGVMVAVVGALLIGGAAPTVAALTTDACLAKKLKEWGKLRNCQAKANSKALEGKSADVAACQATFDEKLAKFTAQASEANVPCRYGINRDGTATDFDTGLQWEQKTLDSTEHDTDNTYSWNTEIGGTAPNGTTFTEFLAALNAGTSVDGDVTSGCFAGHCDWRLPTVEELAGIVDATLGACGGGSGPCLDQAVFGPTRARDYWSATTRATNPAFAWRVFFSSGKVDLGLSKGFRNAVRAVRSAL